MIILLILIIQQIQIFDVKSKGNIVNVGHLGTSTIFLVQVLMVAGESILIY